MRFISHRGNLTGPDKSRENSPDYIIEALTCGFDVEIDVWWHQQGFWLGHDEPSYAVSQQFICMKKLWCHAKNILVLPKLIELYTNCFWHENDAATLTTHGYIWTFPGKLLTCRSVCVMPVGILPIWKEAAGVCSDFVANLKD